jgi:protein-L-isoaspartate(D-aspartate) O-methyltransferase
MVEHQIAARGIRSKTVLGALRKVAREAFLPQSLRECGFRRLRTPVPIEGGQ